MSSTNDGLDQGEAEGEPGASVSPANDPPAKAGPAAKFFDDALSKKAYGMGRSEEVADMHRLAEEITQSLSGFKSLRLSMDRDLKRVVVRVVDEKTDKVIRQLPGDRMIDLVKQMRDLESILIKATA